MKKLLDLREEGKIQPGQVACVTIAHDNWCAINRGGYCNCDPEIRLPKRTTR